MTLVRHWSTCWVNGYGKSWLKKDFQLGSAFMGLVLCYGCGVERPHYQLLYQNFPRSYSIDTAKIRGVQLQWHPQRVAIKTDSGLTKTVAVDQIWGYQEVGGAQYRLYLGSFYEVVQGKTVLIYRQTDVGESASNRYYISRTPNSPILYLNRRNVKAAFQDDVCVQKLMAQLPFREWLKRSNKGYFRLLDAYDYCQSTSK